MKIKSFRGLIQEGTEQTISLHTNTGSTGYRIKKFELFPNKPGAESYQSVVKIFTIPQASVPTTAPVIDFSDPTLLAAGYYEENASTAYNSSLDIIFDNMTFNQDIYVTMTDAATAGNSINYYIELEQVSLDLNENTVATLKDIRNIESNV
jgi:hypothetical protein